VQQKDVVVIVDGGSETIVQGRVARLVRWLVANEARINELPKGALELTFYGQSLKGKLIDAFDL
jgi:hypothetical protein